MAERFDYPASGAITHSWTPATGPDPGQSAEIRDDGVVVEQSAGASDYRYAEGVRRVTHRLGFVRASLTDRLSFTAFMDAVAGREFRYTDWLGLVRKVHFATYRHEFRASAEASDLWSWLCELREDAPPPGLERLPAALYADLMFYLGGARALTAYGRDAVAPSFSRASAATFMDPADGWIKSAASGVARFEAAGLLMEGARTNSCLHSDDFTNAAWTKTNLSVAANNTGTLDPAGANGADLLTATAANATVLQAVTLASASKVFSLYLKRKTGTGNVDITIDNGTGWTTVTINSSTWTRVSKVQTLANPTFGLRLVTSGDEVWAWRGQLEDGATFASSAIPATTTVAVTRAADLLTFPASGNLSAANGSAILVFTPAAIDNGLAQCFLSLDDGSANERIALLTSSAAALRPRARVDDGGVNQADLTVAAGTDDFAVNAAKSVGVVWAANNIRLYSTGIERASDAGATMPTPAIVRIGSAVGGADPVFGWLRDLAIFGRVLSGAEILSVHQQIILP